MEAFISLFFQLRNHSVPVSLPEYLTLMGGMNSGLVDASLDDFYYLSRTVLIKHEQHLDLFDKVFADFVKGRVNEHQLSPEVAGKWLKGLHGRYLSEAEREAIHKLGGLDTLLSEISKRLQEQQERHEGGNKWIGTAGTSPFGNNGYHPEGIRVGGERGQHANAVKVWQQREFRNLDGEVELNTRNMKMALRYLRILSREGVPDELDLPGTIEATSTNGGLLDIRLQPTRKNNVKVLFLLDVGGSMDEHIELCSQLFSAARYQFKHFEYYYFHNCVYETVWKDNARRTYRVPTMDVLNTYNRDYKVIFVGDASMSPYEITTARGSVEHYNEEAGLVWLNRFRERFNDLVWLNPVPPEFWPYTTSIELIREWSENRMFPLTLTRLGQAMKCLNNPKMKFTAR